MEWEDVSTYYGDPTNQEPTTIKAICGPVELVITKNSTLFPGKWVGHAYPIYENVLLSARTLDEAKREFTINVLQWLTDAVGAFNTALPKKPMNDSCALTMQEGGDHYLKMGAYQPWEVAFHQLTPKELKGAMKLTVMAYLAREADKGGMADIRKASHTLQIYLELESRRDACRAGAIPRD